MAESQRPRRRHGRRAEPDRHLSADVLEAILARTDAQTGDILFFGADSFKIVTDAMARCV